MNWQKVWCPLIEGKDPRAELERQQFAEQQRIQLHQSQGSFEALIHGYVNKMKIDNKRTWQDVLKRLENECYTVIPRETKAKDVTSGQIKHIWPGSFNVVLWFTLTGSVLT